MKKSIQKKRASKLRNQRKRGARKAQSKLGRKVRNRNKIANHLMSQMRDLMLPQVDFWRCHVANYLHSNYSTGVWEPLYAGIYEGEGVAIDKDEACAVYALKYQNTPIQDITNEAKNVSHWLSVSSELVFESFTEAHNVLGGVLYEPSNSTVWDFINDRFGFEEYISSKDEPEVELIENDDSEPLDAEPLDAEPEVEIIEEDSSEPLDDEPEVKIIEEDSSELSDGDPDGSDD